MDIVKCFLCSKQFKLTLASFELDKNKLCAHFKGQHGIPISQPYQFIECGSLECTKTFKLFRSYFEHLEKIHLRSIKCTVKNQYQFSPINYDGKFVKMFAEVRANNANTSGSDLNMFVNAASDLLSDCMEEAVVKIKDFLSYRQIDVTDEESKLFFNQFNVNANLKKLKSIEGQIKAIQTCYTYVEPVECYLGKLTQEKKMIK